MKLQIFAVRDNATEAFGNPMFLLAAGQAIRSFSDEVNSGDKDSALAKHPDDYDLYFLGVFDTGTGMFETANPDRIARGKDVVQSVN